MTNEEWSEARRLAEVALRESAGDVPVTDWQEAALRVCRAVLAASVECRPGSATVGVTAAQREEALRVAGAAGVLPDPDVVGVPVAPAPIITDEQLSAAFALATGGPNPFYRCRDCRALIPGVREELVRHATACGVAPTGGNHDAG